VVLALDGVFNTKAEELDESERSVVVSRVQKLMAMMEAEPKSFGWRMRARVGERTRWYELPQVDGDAVFG